MFHVEWLQSALDELAALWVLADSELRRAITAATDDIDRRLSRDPTNEGESRPGRRRIMFVPPLAVAIRIEPDGQRVSVLHVRLYGSRR
jgi:hypothetical protein